jgi:hypothetical protein
MIDSASEIAITGADGMPPVEPPTRTRGFWSLIATQFQGAFSDNILRNLLLSIIVGMGLARNERETFVSVVTVIFSVPFLLFSMPGGWLADRYSKRQITIRTKWMEVFSMVLATAGLATHILPLSLGALTLVATQAALFGPSKYGLLPELLPAKRLSWGNGVIELGTFRRNHGGETAWPRGVRGLCPDRTFLHRFAHQSGHRQCPRRRSNQEVSVQYPRRSLAADPLHAP